MTNAENNSYPTPIDKIRKGNHPYKFKIMEDFEYTDTNWQLEHEFDSQWLRIAVDGIITVKSNENGYAWDGCTPKKSLWNLSIIGVPDGHVDYRTMKPYTYDASLVHDALYQYLDSVPITKKVIDQLFLKMLGRFQTKTYLLFFCQGFRWSWNCSKKCLIVDCGFPLI